MDLRDRLLVVGGLDRLLCDDGGVNLARNRAGSGEVDGANGPGAQRRRDIGGSGDDDVVPQRALRGCHRTVEVDGPGSGLVVGAKGLRLHLQDNGVLVPSPVDEGVTTIKTLRHLHHGPPRQGKKPDQQKAEDRHQPPRSDVGDGKHHEEHRQAQQHQHRRHPTLGSHRPGPPQVTTSVRPGVRGGQLHLGAVIGLVRGNCAKASGHHVHGVREVFVPVIRHLLGTSTIDDHGDEISDPSHEDDGDENSLDGLHD